MKRFTQVTSVRLPVEIHAAAEAYHVNISKTALTAVLNKIQDRMSTEGIKGREEVVDNLVRYYENEIKQHQSVVLVLQKLRSGGDFKIKTEEKNVVPVLQNSRSIESEQRIKKTQVEFLLELMPIYFEDQELREYIRALRDNGNEVGTACECYEDLKKRVQSEPKTEDHPGMIEGIDEAGDEIPDLVAGGLRTLERRMR